MIVQQALRYLYLLWWLKLRLMWRTYRRHLSAAVGALLAVVFFLPIAVGVAFGCFMGFRTLEPHMAEHLLRGVLLGAYLMWLFSPLLGYELTEEYDLSKLFLYPISPRLITSGAILGSLLDLGVLLLLPTLSVALIAFTKSAIAFPIVLLAIGLFLFHTLALSQSINLVSAGVLRSRRARDLMVVLFPLLMTAFYLVSQILPRLHRVNWSRVLDSRAWDLVSYLPSGLAARAVAGAARGDFGPALAFLLVLTIVSLSTLYLASWLVQHIYAGEVASTPIRRRAARKARAAPPPPLIPLAAVPVRRARFGFQLPPAIEAVAAKEFRYLLRDPYFKHSLMMAVYMLVVVIIVLISPRTWRPEAPRDLGQMLLWGATAMMLFMEAPIAFNIFGTEGPAASLLFLFPCARRHILVGKNLVLFTALSTVNIIFALVLSVLARRPQLLPALILWLELAIIMLVSCGNLISIWFPVRIVMRGWSIRRQSASRGLTYRLLHLAIAAVAGCLSTPLLAAVILPIYWISRFWLALTLPLALAYACTCYLASLHFAARALAQREIEIADALRPER